MGKSPSTIFIIGASAQGRVAVELFKSWKDHVPLAFLDDNESLWGTKINGVEVVGNIDILKSIDAPKVHIALGHPVVKNKIAERLSPISGIKFMNAIHHSAVISPLASLGHGISVGANAVINTDAVIGNFCIVNTAAVVEHDAVLEDFVNVSPSACIGGRVIIKARSFIGSGVIVLARCVIGENAIIGMGAVVNRDVESYSLSFGIPAKKIKSIDQSFNWSKVL